MALVIPPGFAQASVEIRNSGDPQPWYVTFGVDVSDAGGDFEAVAVKCATSFGNTIGLQLRTTSVTTGCNLAVGQDGPDRLIFRGNVNLPGTSTAEMLPQNCAALYDKQTARAGRRGRGRMFIPNVLKETTVNEVGVMTPASLTDLQGQASQLLLQLASSTGGVETPMVLLHNTGPGSTDPDLVTGLQVQQVISTQRRRLR